MVVKVYKNGYNIVVDDGISKTRTIARNCKYSTNGDLVSIKNLVDNKYIVSELYTDYQNFNGDSFASLQELLDYLATIVNGNISNILELIDLSGTYTDTLPTGWIEYLSDYVNHGFTISGGVATIQAKGSAGTSSGTHKILTKPFTQKGAVITFDVKQSQPLSTSWAEFRAINGNWDGIGANATDQVWIYRNSSATLDQLNLSGPKYASTTQDVGFTNPFTLDIDTDFVTFKYVFGFESVSVNYWNGSAWVELHEGTFVGSGITETANTMSICIGINYSQSANLPSVAIKNIKLCSADFSTQYPV